MSFLKSIEYILNFKNSINTKLISIKYKNKILTLKFENKNKELLNSYISKKYTINDIKSYNNNLIFRIKI